MSRRTELFARVSPKLANHPAAILGARMHAKVVQLSRGRLGHVFLGIEVLVLRTTGRRSGRPREVPVYFLRDAGTFVTVASNGGAAKPPAWWLNLQARPDAEVLVRGKWRPVTARQASDAEAARLWPKLGALFEGYDHYRTLTTRELAVVVLEPR